MAEYLVDYAPEKTAKKGWEMIEKELKDISNTNLLGQIKDKIDKNSTPLIECVDMGQGMTSGKNEVFIVSTNEILKYKLETDLLKKYIKTQDISSLPQEVSHEPRISLDGGQDGLRFYDQILMLGKKILTI